MREFIIVLLVLMAFFFVKSRLDEKKRIALLLEKYKNEYGSFEPNTPGEVERKSIRYYHETMHSKDSVDDITWNDLGLESIFSRLNTCGSFYGEEALYDMLRTPVYDVRQLAGRGRIIDILDKNEDLRTALMLCFENIGRGESISVAESLSRIGHLGDRYDIKRLVVLDVLCLLLGISASVLIFVRPMAGFFVFFAALFFNLCVYFNRKKKIRDHIGCFAVIIRLISNIKDLTHIPADPGELTHYIKDLSARAASLSGISRGSFLLLSGRSATGSLFDVVLDYFRMFLHLDIIRFYFMQKEAVEKSGEIVSLAHDAGMLDAYISVASFRHGCAAWCAPVFKRQGFVAEGLVHPLVKDCVPNDVDAPRSVLLTGSNASGKSTFLKSVSLACIMSQTIYTVCAKSYEAPLMRCATSMAVTDDVLAGDSYYMAEIRSLKRIIAMASEGRPFMCAIDEVLRGTNTAERVAASTEILKLLSGQCLCFAATHDLELATLLSDDFDNHHFTEEVDTENESIGFSYKLMPGRAKSRNAIKLLSLMGYDEGVVSRAAKRCDRFLETGIWEK